MSSMTNPAPLTAEATAAAKRWVAVFDLDGTLTWHDTLFLFLMGFLRRHPWRVLRFWRMPFALASFLALNHDRGLLKSRVIRMAMGGARRSVVDACADALVDSLGPRRRFRPAAPPVLPADPPGGGHAAPRSVG